MLLCIVQTVYNFMYTLTRFLLSSLTIFHYLLPLIFNLYLFSVFLSYAVRLRKPNKKDVEAIFGIDPKSEEAKIHPEKVVNMICHRGLELDVPENTLNAFKYCLEQGCMFVELDVRLCEDECILLHDSTLIRIAHQPIAVRQTDFKTLQAFDISIIHPQGKKFSPVKVCKLDDALDFLLANKMKMIIDVKDHDQKMVKTILNAFAKRPELYSSACIACFNPVLLYQLRWRNPRIVGAVIYRPYMFYASSFDAEKNALNARYTSLSARIGCLALDDVYSHLWKYASILCGVSAIVLHKDIVSIKTLNEWRRRGVTVVGWCVNRPMEKLYWRSVLASPYITSTVIGEPKTQQASPTPQTPMPCATGPSRGGTPCKSRDPSPRSYNVQYQEIASLDQTM